MPRGLLATTLVALMAISAAVETQAHPFQRALLETQER